MSQQGIKKAFIATKESCLRSRPALLMTVQNLRGMTLQI